MTAENTNPVPKDNSWRFLFVYFNPDDPRIIVPKRVHALGWTINVARPMAVPMMLLMIVAALIPFKILSLCGVHSREAHYITVLVEIIALVLFCSWMSNPSRFQKERK